MGFFDRNRKALIAKGIDPARLPPGQYSTDRFPVLHVGDVPTYGDLSTWSLRVFGAVEQPVTLVWDELLALGSVDITVDIHCVTKWSKFDTVWRGVPLDTVLAAAGVDPAATHLIEHAESGYTTNVPLSEVRGLDLQGQPRAILAHQFDGDVLEADHGYPLRLVVPALYFWKSAKWLRGLELSVGDQPGFWERNGYHNVGDPFREERFGVW
jgi:DMSO/TMAO reductase YedYZ molybdopterin-dependent catalytic subunit